MELKTGLIMKDNNKMTVGWAATLAPIAINDFTQILHAKKLLMVILLLTVCSVEGNLLKHKSAEFCIKDTAMIGCPKTDIISMTSALFGRMSSSSRCITTKNIKIGCSADAIQRIDRWCSGRQNCSFKVSELIQLYDSNCGDMSNYLAVEYSCTPALSPQRCKDSIELKGDYGYFSYPSAALPLLGTKDCPWKINAKPKQKLQILVKSFITSASKITSDDTHCPKDQQMRIKFEERRPQYKHKTIDICQHQSNEPLYESSASDLEMSIPTIPRDSPAVLFYYKVVGCPQITPPVGGWVTQDASIAEVKCNITKETWFLTCKGTSWNGMIGNCSSDGPGHTEAEDQRSGPFSYSIIMAVFLGVLIGVIIGVMLLGIVYLWYRRKPRSPYQDPDAINASYYTGGRDQKDMYTYNMTNTLQRPDTRETATTRGTGYPVVGGGSSDYTAYHSSNCPSHSHSSLYGKYMGIIAPEEPGNTQLITHCPHSSEGLIRTGSAVEHTCTTGPGRQITCYYDCGNRTDKE